MYSADKATWQTRALGGLYVGEPTRSRGAVVVISGRAQSAGGSQSMSAGVRPS